jgi:RNA polymerase sigma-70 factor (TIGR02943 family)
MICEKYSRFLKIVVRFMPFQRLRDKCYIYGTSNQAMSLENQYNSLTAQIVQLNPKKWVETHADYLFRYAITRVRDEDSSRDLVQETFLSALKAMDRFQGKSSERTWLTGILKHKIIDAYRKQSSGLQNENRNERAGEEVEDFFDAADGHWKAAHAPQPFGAPKDPLQEKEFNRVLLSCMQKLPALWASVFSMKHIDEEDTEVILAELRLSSSNFWVIIHRTKLNLRACLQKNWL